MGLQGAVLSMESRAGASAAPLRRGGQVACTAGSGLTGTWKKDKARSDPMDQACAAVQLSWVLRKALALLSTLELEDTEEAFTTRLKAGGIMDVVESYNWDGEVVAHKRRDKRKGEHRGRILRTPDGDPCIDVEFDNPIGGYCKDIFQLSEGGAVLTQVTEMTMKETGEDVRYNTVYNRA